MRQDAWRTRKNASQKKSLRLAIKNLKANRDKKSLPKVTALIDKAAKSRIIHKNKAARLKSRINRAILKK